MRADRAIRRAELAAARSVLRSLHRELGIVRSARVLGYVAVARARGEPFATLGPPVDERDRLTRSQAADLILLDRAITAIKDRTAAFRIARAAVTAGGTRFLSLMIPPIPPGRAADAARTLADRFFNAEGEAAADGDDSFTFTVSRCRFVELLAAVDASHLAPLFCEVDAVYFADPAQPIQLTRSKTLATGGDCCDFRFRLRS